MKLAVDDDHRRGLVLPFPDRRTDHEIELGVTIEVERVGRMSLRVELRKP